MCSILHMISTMICHSVALSISPTNGSGGSLVEPEAELVGVEGCLDLGFLPLAFEPGPGMIQFESCRCRAKGDGAAT